MKIFLVGLGIILVLFILCCCFLSSEISRQEELEELESILEK